MQLLHQTAAARTVHSRSPQVFILYLCCLAAAAAAASSASYMEVVRLYHRKAVKQI